LLSEYTSSIKAAKSMHENDINSGLYYDFLYKTGESFTIPVNTPKNFEFDLENPRESVKYKKIVSQNRNTNKRSESTSKFITKDDFASKTIEKAQERKGRNNSIPQGAISNSVRAKSTTRDIKIKRREQPKQYPPVPLQSSKKPEKPITSIKAVKMKEIKSPKFYEKSVPLRQIPEERQQRFDKISLLPWNILIKIITYNIDNFRNFLMVNPSWYFSALNCLDSYFNIIENEFVMTYSENILFKDSYTSSSRMKFCGTQGIRIDRVLKCENLASTLGKSVTISYTFRYVNEPQNLYKNEFTYDSVPKAPRIVWLHKNECAVFFY